MQQILPSWRLECLSFYFREVLMLQFVVLLNRTVLYWRWWCFYYFLHPSYYQWGYTSNNAKQFNSSTNQIVQKGGFRLVFLTHSKISPFKLVTIIILLPTEFMAIKFQVVWNWNFTLSCLWCIWTVYFPHKTCTTPRNDVTSVFRK